MGLLKKNQSSFGQARDARLRVYSRLQWEGRQLSRQQREVPACLVNGRLELAWYQEQAERIAVMPWCINLL